MNPRWRLILAAVLFLGWMGWLGYTALTKSHGPMVSHAQAAAATHPVVAKVMVGADNKPTDKATVVEALSGNGPATGTEITVVNLSGATGFEGEGDYLLLLVPTPVWRGQPNPAPALPTFEIVGQQRSPGNDLTGVGKPLIYRWNEDVRRQYEKLHP